MRVDRKVNFEFTGECFTNIEKLLRASGRTSKTIKRVETVSKLGKVVFVVPDTMLREYELKFKDNDNVIVLPAPYQYVFN